MHSKVLENVDALKEHWRLERRKRERKKKIHLVVAITAMVAIALAVVGIRVSFVKSRGRQKRSEDYICRCYFPPHHPCQSRLQKHQRSRCGHKKCTA